MAKYSTAKNIYPQDKEDGPFLPLQYWTVSLRRNGPVLARETVQCCFKLNLAILNDKPSYHNHPTAWDDLPSNKQSHKGRIWHWAEDAI